MALTALILIPLLGGLLAWLFGRAGGPSRAPRWIALAASSVNLALALTLWVRFPGAIAATRGAWVLEERAAWIPRLGIGYHLGLDGLSLLMVLLTAFIGVIAVLVSWREITTRVGLFHGVLLWVLTGINGVFLALDLFLFYFSGK